MILKGHQHPAWIRPVDPHGIVCSYVNCGVVPNFDNESIMHDYDVLE